MAQFIPVVRHHNFFIGIGDAALVPWFDICVQFFLFQNLRNIFRGRFGKNKTLKQRIAGHTVGAVKAGMRHFTNSI